MNRIIKKITVSIATAALCVAPVIMNTMSANAFSYCTGANTPGEVNQDGSVNKNDYEVIKAFLENPNRSTYRGSDGKNHELKINIFTADVNGDKRITQFDANLIKKHIDKNSNLYSSTVFKNFYKNVGDVNGDGKVDSKDVTAVRNGSYNSNRAVYADVNGDNKVNGEDATAIDNFVRNKIWHTADAAPRYVSGSNIGGDVNQDSSVDQKDIDTFSKFMSAPQYNKYDINIFTADLNQDKKVDATDFALLISKVNKKK